MPNKALFASRSLVAKPADTVNEAGGVAYTLPPRAALAQLVCTGTLYSTFYATGEDQTKKILELCDTVSKDVDGPLYILKLAVYAHERGSMKDTPVLLLAYTMANSHGLRAEIEKAFPRIIDNGKQLRSLIQFFRSNVVGRRALGTFPKRLVRQWFASRTVDRIVWQSVGDKPSIGDVIKLARPKPDNEERRQLYRYLIGREYDLSQLLAVLQQYELFKATEPDARTELGFPAVPMEMLLGLNLSDAEWRRLIEQFTWSQLRQNINALNKHKALEEKADIARVAERIRDVDAVRKARPLPFQLLASYRATFGNVHHSITEAIQDAMEIAIEHVPTLTGDVWVCLDVSGSMGSPVTGQRGTATSAVRCSDAAALITSAVLRTSAGAEAIAFHTEAIPLTNINRRDSVMTIADQISNLPAGGTACSAPLQWLNAEKKSADLVIIVSDNESWADAGVAVNHRSWMSGSLSTTTALRVEWAILKKRCPNAKLVLIDLQPYVTAQALDEPDILFVGGFSDAVWGIVRKFLSGELTGNYWTSEIEGTILA